MSDKSNDKIISNKENKNYDTLVISSGGIKGFYLLGGIQALVDQDLLLDIDKYVGTSVGAIICYLLAIGYSPVEIVVTINSNKWLEKMKIFDTVSAFQGGGAVSYTPLGEALEKMTINKIGRLLTLGKLQELYGKTLICVTYNMTTCQTEFLGPDNYPDLPCLTAIRMSSNIPIIFDRFKYMDNYYIDGALCENFPIKKGEEIGNKVIGLHIIGNKNSIKDEPDEGIFTYFIRLLQIPMMNNINKTIENAQEKTKIITILTETDMSSSIKFDIEHKTRLEMFFNGYSIVKDKLYKTN
jgi:predicted acylesterase/phospholipase RssA